MPWLCRLRIHSWFVDTRWEPSFYADIVTRALTTATCRRCGECKVLMDARFDEQSGVEIVGG